MSRLMLVLILVTGCPPPATVCTQSSTAVDVPPGVELLDSSQNALLWSTTSELFISREGQNQLLLADAGVDRALIANQEPLTIVASTPMRGETVQLIRLSAVEPFTEILDSSSTASDFAAVGSPEFLVWRGNIAGADSHPPGRARSAGEALLEVLVSPRFALTASLALAEVRASTPSAVRVTVSSIDRGFNRTELASWGADVVAPRIRMGVLGKSLLVLLSNARTQAAWIITSGKVEPVRLHPPSASWLNADLSCATSVCWLAATSLDATWVAAVTEATVGELVLEPGTELLVDGTEASATVHRRAPTGSVIGHVVTCN